MDRLDRSEVEQLIAAAYRLRLTLYGLLVNTLFYTGARVSEHTRVRVEDVCFDLEPPTSALHARQKGP